MTNFSLHLQLISVGLAWKSATKSNKKLVNQKYATLHCSYLGCPLDGEKYFSFVSHFQAMLHHNISPCILVLYYQTLISFSRQKKRRGEESIFRTFLFTYNSKRVSIFSLFTVARIKFFSRFLLFSWLNLNTHSLYFK